jgi:hypothetical protein
MKKRYKAFSVYRHLKMELIISKVRLSANKFRKSENFWTSLFVIFADLPLMIHFAD